MESLPKILLMDDEREFHETLTFGQHRIFQFVSAYTIAEAIHCIRTQRFDLILIDLNMSKNEESWEGFTIIEILKNQKEYTPYIVLTGSKDFKHTHRAFKNGAVDYLHKDDYSEEWIAIFDQAINKKKIGEEKKQEPPKTEKTIAPENKKPPMNHQPTNKNKIDQSILTAGNNLHTGDATTNTTNIYIGNLPTKSNSDND